MAYAASDTLGRETSHFWRFWRGSAISRFGDGVTAVALPLTAVTALHATTFQVSLLTAAIYVSWFVVGLPAGVLVHRWPLRATQVLMDVVRALALLSIPIAYWFATLSIVQLIAVAAVCGLASVVFDVGNSTLLVSVVSRDELARRNSLLSGTDAVTQTAGPSLGGVLVRALTAPGAIVVDVASFMISALILTRLPRPSRAASHGSIPLFGGIRDGWNYVKRHPVIRPCATIAAMLNFVCGGLMALTPVYLVRTLHAPTALVGALIAAEGVGSFAGAAVTPRVSSRIGSARAVLLAITFGGLGSLLMPAASPRLGLAVFFAGSAIFAAGVVVASILTRTHRQQTTPEELLPRVMATVRFLSWSVIPLGAVFAGGVASLAGTRAAFAVVTALAVAVPLYAVSTRLRSLRDLDQ